MRWGMRRGRSSSPPGPHFVTRLQSGPRSALCDSASTDWESCGDSIGMLTIAQTMPADTQWRSPQYRGWLTNPAETD